MDINEIKKLPINELKAIGYDQMLQLMNIEQSIRVVQELIREKQQKEVKVVDKK